MRATLATCTVLAAFAFAPASAAAQRLDGMRAGVAPLVVADSFPSFNFANAVTDSLPIGGGPAVKRWAALASFAVPGSGQLILGHDRWVGYVAVEVLAWLQYSKDIADRAAQERAYKDLSRRVARFGFSRTFPDGDWLYYEWMRDRIESGRFSVNPSGPTVPETDTSTFNGNRWFIALATQPTIEEALAQYEREAIRPEYQWSWRNAQLHYDLYKRTTDKRNDAARAAVKDLLVIGANHFLSMIDAFTTLRLQTRRAQDGGTSIGGTVRW
jgi:hypothetical protein